MSPLSARISICLGNISQLAKPRKAAKSANLSLIKDALTDSFANKNICAPPDFDLHTTNGRDFLLIFCTNSFRFKGYISTSIQPQ